MSSGKTSNKVNGKSSNKVSFGSSLVSCLSPTDLSCFSGTHGTRGGALTSDLAVADSELTSLYKNVVQSEGQAAELEADIKSVVAEVEQLLVHLSDAEDATFFAKSVLSSLSSSSSSLEKLSAKVTKGSPSLANAMTKGVSTARDAVEGLVFSCEKEVSKLGRLIEAKNNVKTELEQQLSNVKLEVSILKGSISQSKAALDRFYAATLELKAMSAHVASLHSARFDHAPDTARSTSSRPISGAPLLSTSNLMAASSPISALLARPSHKDDDAASVASSHRSARAGGKGTKRPTSSSHHHHRHHSHTIHDGHGRTKKQERSDFAAV
jgi:septal ring factor EnvC (AmiA/AmiB activator)